MSSTHRADKVVAAVALLVGFGFVGWTMSIMTWELELLIFGIFMLLWIEAPYIVLAVAARYVSTNWVSRGLLLLAISVVAIFGIWSFDFIDEDAQGGLILIFAPLYQVGAAALVFFAVMAIELVKRCLTKK